MANNKVPITRNSATNEAIEIQQVIKIHITASKPIQNNLRPLQIPVKIENKILKSINLKHCD